ncbi:MAG: electron transport complex subunit E [Christensenella sp.]
MDKKLMKGVFVNGVLNENPTFRLVLGMCPTIAVTTSVTNALGMGAAVIFVLMCSNMLISLLRNFIPEKVRIPCYVVVIAMFVTVVQMVLKAFLPALDASLGIFIPLIVVNCIILARAEAFAAKNSVLPAMVDGIGMGVGFTCSLTLIALVRELLGAGSLGGRSVVGARSPPALMFILAPGGFLVLGLLLALINKIVLMREKVKPKKEAEAKEVRE